MTTADAVRAAEWAIVQEAMDDHRGCAPETCGGSRLDPCRLASLIDRLRELCPEAWKPLGIISGPDIKIKEHEEQPLIWHPRTWADVRVYDTVRMPGRPETRAVVATLARHGWNIDPRTGTSSYNPPQPMEWSEIVVRFAGVEGIEGEQRHMNPAAPVEIQLTQTEVDALDMMGWMNRVSTS